MLKLSLHQSGVCQVALLEGFFAQHLEWREDGPDFRSILRWQRLSTQEDRGQVAASILFASDGFWPEQEAIPNTKQYTALAPPPHMCGRMVNVVYSREDPNRIAKLGVWTDELLFSTQLPSGEFVCLMQSIEPLPEDFFAFAPVLSPYSITLGIDENEMDDARGISCFDCAQLFEGHGCIRSLHNMRLMSVAVANE
ncbi:hypothetical protein EN904_01565 [Mesorhizobium sp. M7A.F.Ca.CA.001.07.2.1]|uniref:hypothetical protein n=3 Tax=Phyllobacteriaceae TaxID=69277 RepID=UPI000FCA046F|nr:MULTISPECIES: hypothetical protein [Mesorhizobium]MCF6121594.1 hypothetical protein [Mesorhizobium ciceri]MCQ8812173.1 hypothetical protein [Mesorhizobium sp. SEMIA396]RUX81647.1 hypothetical protein EN983_03630 [Mesorhizobium sp. M7A.F.Ca.CA.004.08.2.1]RUX87014.1 hypothetical protein EN982_12605 [Mesorhizobium sp. M7A.F.Ca.CA.004.08.1.1]RUY02684.1 hypothetical protein EN985_18680 [Mesorhizobium sp. M7A.F.Ca.CA.004.04.1.1]